MSGTSLDGVDAALVHFDAGQPAGHLIHTAYLPYPEPLREKLLALHFPGNDELHRAALLANELSGLYSLAISRLLAESTIALDNIQAIGCHGQTVRHRPDAGYTTQLVNPSFLAELTGIAVVADFRSRDIAAGGQGAPLVPAFHAAALRHPTIHRVIVNIGGISNLTDLPPSGKVIGFDCGPGNLLMDAWCQRHTGQQFDHAGAWGAGGAHLPELFKILAAHIFFSAPPPKSAGREEFNLDWLTSHLSGDESAQDVQATLLRLTTYGIVHAIETHCPNAQEVYICGGGARNTALMQSLRIALTGKLLASTDALGVNPDWLEAHAFAWLARQTLLGLPGNLTEVTGARHPCVLGAIYPA
ncbi:MAG TPA: anhydro-N-acetylmuramic acid kinase [Sulfuriferula sp.]|nr:anhydro-N-acetylmuramic acid kinase [Sulfuriferula sp.]